MSGALYATLWFQLIPAPSDARRARGNRRRLVRDAPSMRPGEVGAEAARLLFAERLGALLPLTPEGERPKLVAEALAAWRAARSSR